MKIKTTWKTIAGLAAAAGAFLKFSENMPIHDIVTPAIDPGLKPPTLPKLPGRYDECPAGFYRKLIEGQWRCWPKER